MPPRPELPPLSAADDGAPTGSGPSRRAVLRLLGVTGAAGIVTLGSTRLAFGAPVGADTLVVLTLRGGLDGLSMIPPVGDPAYAKARPTLAIPANATKRAGATFGLHPALAPVFPLWDAGNLAAVHAVGQTVVSRSHTEAMTALEQAAPGTSVTTGWIDRAVAQVSGATAMTAVQVGDPNLPGSLAGTHPKYALGTLDGTTIAASDSIVPLTGWQKAWGMIGAGIPTTVTGPMTTALASTGALSALPPAPTPTEAGYPPSHLGAALYDVARLVKAGVGLRFATVTVDGWDLHSAMGTAEHGAMATHLRELALALAAFATHLGADLDQVTVVTQTEFGRRVAENGSGGTDHGLGSALLVLGGGVKGTTVHGPWPTLAAGALKDGDLAVTTDYRQVLAELLVKRCQLGSVSAIFPGLTVAPLGVVDARPA